jgi:hypothetical protein
MLSCSCLLESIFIGFVGVLGVRKEKNAMKGMAVIQQFEYKELGVFRGHSSALLATKGCAKGAYALRQDFYYYNPEMLVNEEWTLARTATYSLTCLYWDHI